MANGVLGEVAKDAYRPLRNAVARWAGSDVEKLERSPKSEARQKVVAEILDELPPEDLTPIRDLAQRLVEAVRASTPVGIDIGRLSAISVKLRNITVTDGAGLIIDEVETPGAFELDGLTVGGDSKKKT